MDTCIGIRTAVIAEGVYRRWLDNPTSGTEPEHLGAAVERLAELAAAEVSI